MHSDDRLPEFGAGRVADHALLGSLSTEPTAEFAFDGRKVEGRPGEPIAAALIAAGVRMFRTMPRFGDARGGYCMVGRCSDCLVMVDGVPGVRACATPVVGGLEVQTQQGIGEGAWSDDEEPLR